MREPRDPLLKVLIILLLLTDVSCCVCVLEKKRVYMFNCNDPSAGSPTETLLRLLLPLND